MDIKYSVVYSTRRTVSLQIKDGALIVRSPHGVTTDKIDSIIEKHAKWIRNAMERQSLKLKKERSFTDEEIAAMKKEAKRILCAKVSFFSEIMGLEYGRITITSAKTRFGSCSSSKNLSFSYRLMLYPEAAIDYVVVHELAHLVHMNHSKNFYDLIAKYLPDYKEYRRMLKE